MCQSSASLTDKGSDIEYSPGTHEGLERRDNDLEKQGSNEYETLGRIRTRDSNAQALPGVQVDEDDFAGCAEPTTPRKEDEKSRRSETGRDGLASAIERAVSRTSIKSGWNSGPPPDGGVKAWTAGKSTCGLQSRVLI